MTPEPSSSARTDNRSTATSDSRRQDAVNDQSNEVNSDSLEYGRVEPVAVNQLRQPLGNDAGLLSSRIVGAPIPPLLPAYGDVRVLIVGEAPGPRGADKSGVPFFGDAAGKHLYLALRKLGAVVLPDSVDEVKWDGKTLRAAGYRPIANGVSLTNAFDHCPTDDGHKFRAPSRDELGGELNTARLQSEIDSLRNRSLAGVVTLGKVATRTMQHLIATFYGDMMPVHTLPHPSAQGLLSMAPNRGRGARMSDLQAAWIVQCMDTIRAAGFDSPSSTGERR